MATDHKTVSVKISFAIRIPNMKLISFISCILFVAHTGFAANHPDSNYYRANHPFIQLTGRIDYSDSLKPKLWAPGIYISIRFSGTYCIIELNDEEKWGTTQLPGSKSR